MGRFVSATYHWMTGGLYATPTAHRVYWHSRNICGANIGSPHESTHKYMINPFQCDESRHDLRYKNISRDHPACVAQIKKGAMLHG